MWVVERAWNWVSSRKRAVKARGGLEQQDRGLPWERRKLNLAAAGGRETGKKHQSVKRKERRCRFVVWESKELEQTNMTGMWKWNGAEVTWFPSYSLTPRLLLSALMCPSHGPRFLFPSFPFLSLPFLSNICCMTACWLDGFRMLWHLTPAHLSRHNFISPTALTHILHPLAILNLIHSSYMWCSPSLTCETSCMLCSLLRILCSCPSEHDHLLYSSDLSLAVTFSRKLPGSPTM